MMLNFIEIAFYTAQAPKEVVATQKVTGSNLNIGKQTDCD